MSTTLADMVDNSSEFSRSRAWLGRFAERQTPSNADVLQELNELKQIAVKSNNQTMASAAWCFEQIAKGQDRYLAAFDDARCRRFYACWQKLEHVEILLVHLERHYVDNTNAFGVRTIRETTEKLQSLFPYRVFLSPGLEILEAICSICGQIIRLRGSCGHKRLELYDGELCGRTITKARANHIAIVENPAQKYSVAFAQDGKSYNYASVDYLIKGLGTPWSKWKYDIEKRIRASTKLDLSKYRDTRRNETCPCGSKRKFKKCCLDKLTEEYDHYQFHFVEQPHRDIAKLVPSAHVDGIDDMMSSQNLPENPSDIGMLVDSCILSTDITSDATSIKL